MIKISEETKHLIGQDGKIYDEGTIVGEAYAIFSGYEKETGNLVEMVAENKLEFHNWIKENELTGILWSVKPLSVGKIIRVNQLRRKVRNNTATPEEIAEFNLIEIN